MDAAKATAFALRKSAGDGNGYFNASAFVNKPLPLLVIGTTAGTGSEVTSASVLTFNTPDGIVKRPSKIRRKLATSRSLRFDVYGKTLSERTTVATALDAICHAVEAYYSKKSVHSAECIQEKRFLL